MHLQFPCPIGVAAIGHPDPVQRHPAKQTQSQKMEKVLPANMEENLKTPIVLQFGVKINCLERNRGGAKPMHAGS